MIHIYTLIPFSWYLGETITYAQLTTSPFYKVTLLRFFILNVYNIRKYAEMAISGEILTLASSFSRNPNLSPSLLM